MRKRISSSYVEAAMGRKHFKRVGVNNMAYNKLSSRRYRITLWSMALTTVVTLYSIITQYDANWIGITLPLLIAIPSVYIAGDSYSKQFCSKNAPTE